MTASRELSSSPTLASSKESISQARMRATIDHLTMLTNSSWHCFASFCFFVSLLPLAVRNDCSHDMTHEPFLKTSRDLQKQTNPIFCHILSSHRVPFGGGIARKLARRPPRRLLWGLPSRLPRRLPRSRTH